MIHRYNESVMASIWSDVNKYKTWYAVEMAHFSTSREVTVEPPADHEWENIALEIGTIEKTTKHDLAAFVIWMEKWLENRTTESRFIHYGLTSSDIVDTAFSLQIKQANTLIHDRVMNLCVLINGSLSADTKIMGRTHGQWAEPIKLSQKASEYVRILTALSPYKQRYYGKFAGSVGSGPSTHQLPSFSARTALKNLGLDTAYSQGQIIPRTYYAAYMTNWGILASYLEKFATDMRLLAQSDVAEVSEGFGDGQMGSSSMPHKRNPIGFENICGCARIVRSYSQVAMENIVLWNERDMSHSAPERIIFPDASILLSYMLVRLTSIVDSMVVNTDKMNKTIELAGDLVSSQKEMLADIQNGMPRYKAHEKWSKKSHGSEG